MTRSACRVASGAPIVTVRPVQPADLDRVRSLVLAAYAEYAQVLSPEVWAHYQRDLADVEHRTRAGCVLVAESNGGLVGTATFYPDASQAGMGWPTDCAAVRAVAVSPEFRSRGVAELLMTYCAQLAHAAGARSLRLHTASFMSAAVALYTRLGFVRSPQDNVEVCGPSEFHGSHDRSAMTIYGYRLDLT
jgi:GNAT superfamily N-acetyltransferase